MASLLSPPSAADSGRISQLLPSVKCSSCNLPVPIHELGDHVCPAPSAAKSLSNFLPLRLQNLVSTPPQPDSPKPAAPPSTPPRPPVASPRRSRGISFGFKKVNPLVPPPAPSRPPMPPSPLSLTAQRTVRPPPQKDSRDSFLSSSSSSRAKSPAPSQHVPPVPFPVLSHGSTLSVRSSRARATSNASSSNSAGSRPSVDVSRVRSPSNASQPRPSVESYRSRNLSSATTNSSSGRPSYDSIPRARTPSDNSHFRPPMQSSLPNHSDANSPPSQNTVPPQLVPRLIPPPAPIPTPQDQPTVHHHHLSSHEPEPDTKIGGEAGMAGVGRRGFQAAARAALFTSPTGTDGRRSNTPGMLDISRANNPANTPPLSPSHSSSHSPLSPFSQSSPVSAGHSNVAFPTGTNGTFGGPMTPRTNPLRTPSPNNLEHSPFSDRSISTPLQSVDDLDPPSPTAKLSSPSRGLHAKYNNRPLSPMSESDYEGLAYADSTDGEDDQEFDDLPTEIGGHSSPRMNEIEFPSVSPRSKTASVSAYSPRVPARSFSVASSVSNYTARTTAKSTGALDRAMEALYEDIPTSPTTSAGVRSPVLPFLAPVPESHDARRDSSSKLPKPPTRAYTSPTGKSRHELQDGKKPARSVTSASAPSSNAKACVRCDNKIEDGKWIPMDGGGVLCDKCWKNMYLPKCRRCNLPIEKQAVSSSDGQLKGKYHRDCFNCHSCHKLFPDKTFYVFDGKPFCEYHYHEANGSLCASPTCGRPVEGPCAVSHAGDKYHPEHFVCQYPRCTERLEEYWEMDGRMLCEKHMNIEEEAAVRGGRDLMDDLMLDLGATRNSFRNSLRAMKRVTRFIDIAGLGGNGLR